MKLTTELLLCAEYSRLLIALSVIAGGFVCSGITWLWFKYRYREGIETQEQLYDRKLFD